jgi:1-phosphofructokinase family hexose kinase
MFLCISLNPAVDKRLTMGLLQVGKVNRASKAQAAPGGKTAHVAMVLRTLGAEPLWLGFAGGATGVSLVEGLREMEIQVESVPIAASTRMNLEIIEDEERVTEVLEPGPYVTTEELQRFQECFEKILTKAVGTATVILSGSLPPGAPGDFYATLIALVHKYRGRVLLDTSAEPLKLGITAHPHFVKPNQEEAEWLSGSIIRGPRSAGDVLKQFLRMGAAAAAISLGADGMVWRSGKQEQALFARVPKQASRFSVGSGDASLAGFAYAAQQDLPPVEALRLAAACGVANCLADVPGRARAADIAWLKEEIRVETLG